MGRWEIESARLRVRGGRQAIVFDDSRFIGDIAWRQNMQTFDGVLVESRAVEDTVLTYAYISHVNNIFGDGSSVAVPNARRDFESESHLFNAKFSRFEAVNVTAFAYLLELRGRNSTGAANSSDTLGFRLSGKTDINEDISLSYIGSYAFQYDNNDNPTDYKANYWLAEATVGTDPVSVTVGFEHLGTSNGRAQFRTPLSTAHKFNGWADSFLDNGGPKGLQDVYVALSGRLPSSVNGRLVFHKFNTADGGGDLGWEVNARLTKRVNKNLFLLMKYAYFDGPRDPDIFRFWTDIVISF